MKSTESARTAVKIVPLEIGRLDADLMELVGTPGRAVMPVPSWLIEHPRGLVLFDTGLHRKLQTDVSELSQLFKTTIVDFDSGEELSTRIRAAGYAPEEIDLVVFSHLHFDHAGGTTEVPNARLVVQDSEWKTSHHPKLVEFGLYDPPSFDIGHDVQEIEGVHDVFGDGTLVCIPTPGHTPGHQALRVELPSGPVVLTGDCVYFESMLDAMIVPEFAFDRDQQLTSMRALKALRDDGCKLLYGHDLEQFRSLPKNGLS
jgi:N-acyl homoserine lactone hydrolase